MRADASLYIYLCETARSAIFPFAAVRCFFAIRVYACVCIRFLKLIYGYQGVCIYV